jgi:hypothetical protein
MSSKILCVRAAAADKRNVLRRKRVMNYSAKLSYFGKNREVARADVNISSFSVVGGTSRTIDLKATSDFSISSELEQARRYKNITLFMPPAKDAVDMETAMELTQCEKNVTELEILLIVKKFSNGRKVEDMQMVARGGILYAPRVVANHELMIQFFLFSSSAEVYHGTYNNREKLISVETI